MVLHSKRARGKRFFHQFGKSFEDVHMGVSVYDSDGWNDDLLGRICKPGMDY
jgi:hypothetical protein